MPRLDQYYTQRHISKACLKKLSLNEYDLILEPSAGDGAFFDFLPKEKRVGIDLVPTNPFGGST